MLKPSQVFILFLAAVALTVTTTHLIGAQRELDLRELEDVAAAELKETNTPGAAIAVVSGDRALLLKGLGIASIETGDPVTSETVWRLGGLSKFLTATALVSLARDGKVDLAAPIGAYAKDLSPKISRITAHQLLNQTAGIIEDHLMQGLYDDAALGKMVRSWGDDWVIAEPGRFSSSSHPGYAIAGVVMEAVAGKPFDDVMGEKLFTPMGMSRSTFRPSVAMTYPLALGHRAARGQQPTVVRPMALNSFGWPSHSMFSNVRDLSRFLIAFVNGGRLDGRQVLDPSVIATLSRTYATNPVTADGEGYGVDVSQYAGHALLSASPTWAGLANLLEIVPDQRFALLILANGGSTLVKTAEKAKQMFLPPHVEPQRRTVAAVTMTEAEASRLVGTYTGERIVSLFLKGGRLFMNEESRAPFIGTLSYTGGAEVPVTKIGENQFSVTAVGSSRTTRFALTAGQDGKPEYLHVGSRALRRK